MDDSVLLMFVVLATVVSILACFAAYCVGYGDGERHEAGRWAGAAGGGPVRHRRREYAVVALPRQVAPGPRRNAVPLIQYRSRNAEE